MSHRMPSQRAAIDGRPSPRAEPLVVAGRLCHGGFDDAGRYVTPRTKGRNPAVAAWQAQFRDDFGADILDRDGALDRAALAARAFVDDDTRKELEAITHPAIGEEYLRRLAEIPGGSVVVHDVPLLVEANRAEQYAGVIVVEAPLDLRLDRLAGRGVPREDAERRIALQASDDQRRAVATWLVDNGDGLAELEPQVDRIWAELRERLAALIAAATDASDENAEG